MKVLVKTKRKFTSKKQKDKPRRRRKLTGNKQKDKRHSSKRRIGKKQIGQITKCAIYEW